MIKAEPNASATSFEVCSDKGSVRVNCSIQTPLSEAVVDIELSLTVEGARSLAEALTREANFANIIRAKEIMREAFDTGRKAAR